MAFLVFMDVFRDWMQTGSSKLRSGYGGSGKHDPAQADSALASLELVLSLSPQWCSETHASTVALEI